jgi:hypothetical protein
MKYVPPHDREKKINVTNYGENNEDFFLKTQINYPSHPGKSPDTSTDTNSGTWLINTEEQESRTDMKRTQIA